jgi:hypothetical protein
MKKILTIWLLVSVFSSYGLDTRPLIEKGNKAYADGLYSNALDCYKQAAGGGMESAELYYNMGNACFKMNDIPSSILYYERALKLDPGNEDCAFNLKIANSRISDKIEAIPEMFYKRWFATLTGLLSSDAWAKLSILLLVLSLVCATLYFISRVVILRKGGFWLGSILLFLALVFLVFSYRNYMTVKSQDYAIVFSPSVTVKSSPDDKSVDLFVLHEGSKVRVMDHIGNWYEIRIANGSVGWLPTSSIERI